MPVKTQLPLPGYGRLLKWPVHSKPELPAGCIGMVIRNSTSPQLVVTAFVVGGAVTTVVMRVTDAKQVTYRDIIALPEDQALVRLWAITGLFQEQNRMQPSKRADKQLLGKIASFLPSPNLFGYSPRLLGKEALHYKSNAR